MDASWILNRIGAVVCHQIPDRSFQIRDDPLPLCARCTGVYAGVAVGVLALIIIHRLHGRKLHSNSWPLFAITVIALFSLHAMGERLGIWHSSNDFRLALGLVTGCAFSQMLIPLAFRLWGIRQKAREDQTHHYWADCLLLFVPLLALRHQSGLLQLLGLLSIGGLILLFLILIVAIVGALTRSGDEYRPITNRLARRCQFWRFRGGVAASKSIHLKLE